MVVSAECHLVSDATVFDRGVVAGKESGMVDFQRELVTILRDAVYGGGISFPDAFEEDSVLSSTEISGVWA